NNIFKQILLGRYNLFYEYSNYNILGWCIYKSRRYFVIQHKENNNLLCLQYIDNQKDKVTLYKEETQLDSPDGIGYIYPQLYKVRIYTRHGSNPIIYTQNLNESDDIPIKNYELVKRFVEICHEKGQFYL